jgi:Tol biopolymer transport system component
MPLVAGTRLGPYEIIAPLGAGGMGEVYRARDTKLGRDVALKVLPDALARDQERLARFEREAKVLASLNHPNIAQIYGVEDSGDVRALVMELVPGATLGDRIKTGALPLSDALVVAKQIADALEAAHDRGVIHRDLKPANVMHTPDGVVKVLDFGLAAVALVSSPNAADPMNSPTLTMHATQAGMIMGTAAYMSPEQAAGKPVDKRADIWSFGVVVWEMLCGRHLFGGETVSHTLADVLRGPIDFDKLPKETPRAIRDLLRRCLDRDVKNRLRDIGEARVVIGRYLADPGSGSEADVGVGRGPGGPPHKRWVWPMVAGVATLALIVAGVLLYNATRPAPLRPLIRANIDLDDNTPLARGGGGSAGNMLAVSPDGARLALTLRSADGKLRLYTRLLNQSEVTPLAGTENASFPFFSPAGDWIGFLADNKLKKIAVEGGAAVTLCDAPNLRGASWGDDGNIIAALNTGGALSRVPSEGGTPVPVTKLNSGEVTHRWPQVLPGSQAVLFTASTHTGREDDGNIEVISLKTGERKTVQRGGFSPRYLATSSGAGPAGAGHLIYLHQSTLFAVPFDPGRLAATGSPAPILEDVSSTSTAGGDFAFAGSPHESGTFVYLSGKGQLGGYSISWVDRSGKTQLLHAPIDLYSTPRFSPDGKRLAFSIVNGQSDDIWVKDLDRDTPSRLSFLPGQNRFPVWTPDGKNIVFQSTNPAAPGMYWIRSDGSGEAQRLTDGKHQEAPNSFSPDGKRLAFYELGNGTSMDIFTAPVEGDPGRGATLSGAAGVRLGKAELFVGTPFLEVLPAFSPDGRWLAYQSNESGTFEVYVRPFPGPGGRWQISTGGGLFPVWSRDGRELLFETMDQRVMAVSYTVIHQTGGDSFAAGKPQVWTEVRLRSLATPSNYDLAPDGKRLAAMLPDDASGDKPHTHLTFLLNFFDELRRRAPAK